MSFTGYVPTFRIISEPEECTLIVFHFYTVNTYPPLPIVSSVLFYECWSATILKLTFGFLHLNNSPLLHRKKHQILSN